MLKGSRYLELKILGLLQDPDVRRLGGWAMGRAWSLELCVVLVSVKYAIELPIIDVGRWVRDAYGPFVGGSFSKDGCIDIDGCPEFLSRVAGCLQG